MKSGTDTETCTFEVGVYTFSGGEPVTLVGAGATEHIMSSSTPAWVVVSGLSNSLVASTVYVVAFSETNGNARNHYDTGVADDRCQDNVVSGSGLAATWGHAAHADRLNSVYATYSVGGAARRVMVVS